MPDSDSDLENEVKVLEIDIEQVQSALENLGAEKDFDGTIEDEIYEKEEDYPGKPDILRLRRMISEDYESLHLIKKYKRPEEDIEELEGAKSMNEEDERIENKDREEKRSELESKGWHVEHENTKTRIKYVYETPEVDGKIEYVIDNYQGDNSHVPPLLEAEVIDGTYEDLTLALEKIGFSIDEAVDWGTDRLLEHYSED